MTDLGRLGGSDSEALGINQSGEVVGDSLIPGDNLEHAFLDFGGTMYDLNNLVTSGLSPGDTLARATAINDNGWIVVTGLQQSYLLEPNTPLASTPEPTSLLLFGAGISLLQLIRSRT